MAPLLLVSVFVIATCGLVYELIAGTLASYLLGDSVTQFSTVIGCYLFAMGIGSWLSRYVNRNLLGFFIMVEILVGLVGGCSAALLFILFNYVYSFRLVLYLLVGIVGILVGVEIPILLRILKERYDFKDLVSLVFTFDYIGALFASILFPLVLVPHLGLVKSSFLFGILNTLVAIWVLYAIREEIPWIRLHKIAAIAVLGVLTFGFVYSEKIISVAEASAFTGKVIYAESSPYQRIVLTRQGKDLRLYLNSNLQFSSVDEYRYHEALVHPVMAGHKNPQKILVIGGGDGLAVREILKYPSVREITLVDLDPAMTRIFSSQELLTEINGKSLHSPKVSVANQDAFLWLREYLEKPDAAKFDVIVMDVPDPSNFSIGKMYSLTYFRLLKAAVAQDGLIAIQSTSPMAARKSFWCINNTLEAAGLLTAPYHVYVPSFGEWGFLIASLKPYELPAAYPQDMKYISVEGARDMFFFPPDMARVETKIQRLDDQVLVHYFAEEWSEYLNY